MASLTEQIQSAPRVAFIPVGLVVAVLYYFSIYDDGAQIQSKINQANSEIETQNKNLEAAQKTAGEKGKFEEQVNLVSSQLQAALEYLPNQLKVEELNKQIEDEARHAGVKLRSFSPTQTAIKEFYEEIPVRVDLEGSYSNLTLFLTYITQLKRIVTIKDVTLVPSSRGRLDPGLQVNLQGTLIAYRYIEKSEKDKIAKPSEAPK